MKRLHLAVFASFLLCSLFAEDLTVRADLDGRLKERLAQDLVGLPILASTWDESTTFALELRARLRCLRGGVTRDLSGQEQANVARLVKELVACEAASPRMVRSGLLAGREGRGWGTVKPTRLQGISFSNAVENWMTATAMLAIAEAIHQFPDLEGADGARACFKAVAENWASRLSAVHPVLGRYFVKADVEDPKTREGMVFSSQALWALALWHGSFIFSKGSPEASAFKNLALEFAAQIQKGVVLPVLGDGIHLSKWANGPDWVKADGTALRGEDVNRGSYVVELVSELAREKVADGAAVLFTPEQVASFGKILSATAFPREADGKLVTRFWYDSAELKKASARGRDLVSNWQTEVNKAEGWTTATGWRRFFNAKEPGLDTGYSLRTSWGWAPAAATDKKTFRELGDFYQAAFGNRKGENMAANTFLVLAAYREQMK